MPSWSAARIMPAGRSRMRGRDLGEMAIQSGREETPIVQVFEMRPMAEAVPAAAGVDGPSHESSLPRRPPDHWLRPPRKSVVNALLPWRVRAEADSVRPGPRTRRAVPIGDRRGHSEREQRLLETDHRRLRVSSQFDHIQAQTPPAPPGGPPGAENRRPCGRAGGRTTDARVLGSRGRRFGLDLLYQTGRDHPGRSRAAGHAGPPRRCGSDRIGCLARAAALGRVPTPIEATRRPRGLTPPCVPS